MMLHGIKDDDEDEIKKVDSSRSKKVVREKLSFSFICL